MIHSKYISPYHWSIYISVSYLHQFLRWSYLQSFLLFFFSGALLCLFALFRFMLLLNFKCMCGIFIGMLICLQLPCLFHPPSFLLHLFILFVSLPPPLPACRNLSFPPLFPAPLSLWITSSPLSR